MPTIAVTVVQRVGVTVQNSTGAGAAVSAALPAASPPTIFKRQKFSGTPQSGYTTLTANQLAGVDPIVFDFAFRVNSLAFLRNGIPMEYDVEFTEAVDRTSITLVGAYDAADKFEARYAKN